MLRSQGQPRRIGGGQRQCFVASIAVQGLSTAKDRCQRLEGHANDVVVWLLGGQGRAASYDGEGMAPIIHHRDVQRNLLAMKSLTNASRAIAYACAHAIDLSQGEEGSKWRDRANILTPLAKAFPTDIGVEVASIGLQIHGGMGFIEETGAAQLVRDARIAPIYEGTNGIQAIDLVTRKLPLADGDAIEEYINELRQIVDSVRASNRPEFGDAAEQLSLALDDLDASKNWLLDQLGNDELEAALSGATPFLRLMGGVCSTF